MGIGWIIPIINKICPNVKLLIKKTGKCKQNNVM